MIVLIVNTGRVEQRIVPSNGDLTTESGESFVARLRSAVNAEVASRPFLEASARLEALADRFEPADRDTVRAVVRALDEALLEEREERVVLAGTSNLARFGTDFPLTIGPVLEALEEHVVLLKLLGTLGSETGTGLGHDAVAVRIGHENPHQGLASTSVVSTGYAAGSEVVAGLGVLGPTRMDYPTAMATVRAVARYVSEILGP
jgi:heat-inducible transcriptional repressor